MRGISTTLEKSKEGVQSKDPRKYLILLLTSVMSRMKLILCFICKNVKIIKVGSRGEDIITEQTISFPTRYLTLIFSKISSQCTSSLFSHFSTGISKYV